MADQIVPSECNTCGRQTDHDVIWQESSTEYGPQGEVLETRRMFVRCRGCKDSTLRTEAHYTVATDPEDDPSMTVSYSPVRLWRRAPEWFRFVEEDDPDLFGLLEEVYTAVNDLQLRLLSMGVRAALDRVMVKILGGDVGTFERKLDQMVTNGHLTQRQRENLEIVIDAGSASTHRGFRPPKQLLEEMVTVMENILREHYVTGPMLQTAKISIPPRPPRHRP
jgi:hypothetical protein